MKINKLTYSVFLYFFITNIAYSSSLVELNNHIKQQNYKHAYSIADSIKLDFEGDPEFDYLYALAALETGHLDKAVFALERVIANKPDNQVARLELARAYYHKGEFEKSKLLFNLMLSTSPPENVQTNINSFLVKIDKFLDTSSYKTSAFIEAGIGWDDNINSASDETTVSLGNLVFTLNSSQKIDAMFSTLKAGANYLKRINKFDSFFIGGQLETKDNLSEELDTDDISLRTGYLYINNKTRISVPLSFQKIYLDGEGYRNLNSISAEWSTFSSEKEYSSYVLQYGTIEYEEQSVLDLSFVNIGYSNTFLTSSKDHTIGISLFLGTEMPDIDANEQNTRDYYGLALQLQNSDYLGLSLRLSAYQFEHQKTHQSFGKLREDTLVNGYIGYKWKISNTWSIETGLGYTQNTSTIDIYEYDRTTAELKLRVDL